MTRQPIGLFGGSFDPIHLGHLRSAEEVREAIGLERVWFVPAAAQPRKPDRELADGAARLRMIELAIAGNPAFAVTPIEIERGGVSYSVDTLAAFRAHHPDADLNFILGADAFRDIHTWREVARIFELTNVVVTTRPPLVAEPSIAHLPVAAREAFCYHPGTLSYRHSTGTVLRFLAITGIDISATAIRSKLREGKSVRYLVPSEVEQYIRREHLYSRAGAERD